VLNCSRTANQILKACASLLLNSLDYNKFSRLFIDLTKAYYAYDNDELLLSDYNEECCAWNSLLDDILKKYEGETIDINRFLREVDFNSKASDKPEGSVPCLTIQASKGMEFRHVYLIGLVEDYLPSWFAVKKGNSSAEMQEERRNCFAAITRTQECLTLTHSSEVFGKARAPSRFLYEMGYQSP
jgi:DNA helicase-2/ATP-dependent DNA helicase PcrA